MLAPPQPGITSAAFTAKPIFSMPSRYSSSSTVTITATTTTKQPQQEVPNQLPDIILGKRPRSPLQPDRASSSNANMRPDSSYGEWVLESEFLGRTRDSREVDVDIKGKGKERETDNSTTDDTSPNKRQRVGRPTMTTMTTMQQNETTSYVLYCPNGRKVLLSSDGIVDVAQLCLWVDEEASPASGMPTPPADSAQPQKLRTNAIPLLPSGPPKPIRISAYEPLPVRELVRLSSRYHFLLTPPNNTPIEVTKAISLVCPEARLGSNTPSIATETGHLVAHVSRLIHGKWYCRRTPISSVPLMWPANTTLSLPVSQPLPLLALPRKLIVHVGPEVGPGAPPEFIGSGLTYFSYSRMDTLEVVLSPLKGQVFTMPGPDVEADDARLEAERGARVARLERVQRQVVDDNETEDEEESTQTQKNAGRQNKENKEKKGKEPARPASSSRERRRRTSSSTSPSMSSSSTLIKSTTSGKNRSGSSGSHHRELIMEMRQGALIPSPVCPRAESRGPSNPLQNQKQRTADCPPAGTKKPKGPNLPRLHPQKPGPHAPERLPPLRGFIREMDALIEKQKVAVPKRRTTPPRTSSTPSSSSQLPQHLHQFMRQAPVQDRTRYGEQLVETLQERHRTYQDRIHCINLKPKPQQKQQHQQQLARPVQKKRFLPPKPSQGLLEQLPQSMQMSVQSQWLWQTTSTGSDDSHND